jgi:D-3-phosphoglycerate dehydrogenase/C-terminal binding protein
MTTVLASLSSSQNKEQQAMSENRFRVVVADYLDDDLAPEREILGDLADVEALAAETESDLHGRIDDADAVLLYHNVRITAEVIARLQHCRLIARCGVGVDNVDSQAARAAAIDVSNVPDYGTEEVADSAIGLTLALGRGIHQANSMLRERRGAWDHSVVAPLSRLRGRVFGIVGLGRIGTATALRAKALGMDVMFFDPYCAAGGDKALGIRQVRSFGELLAQSNILSLHCPLTDETRCMVDAGALAELPHGAILVNTARGAVVDVASVAPAIESGRLAGAGIDVLPEEPPEDDPLLVAWRDPTHPAYDRVIINPHIAFYCEEGLMEMRVKGAENCRRALVGEPVLNVVN